ncbi:GntR family transcriptional regulator, partial [Escherichia sp. TWPC-MK]
MTGNQSTVENAKEKLDRWLKDGITTPGGKLPSERELGELLGIKRMTLRQALLNLEAESKIFRKDRKGWFVTQPRFNYSPELSASFQRAAISGASVSGISLVRLFSVNPQEGSRP